jgi:hypothetical protein
MSKNGTMLNWKSCMSGSNWLQKSYVTTCSPLKVNRRFGGTCHLIFWCCLISRSFLAWLILRPWRWRHVLPKRRLAFNGLRGVISRKLEPFITGYRVGGPGYVHSDRKFYLQVFLVSLGILLDTHAGTPWRWTVASIHCKRRFVFILFICLLPSQKQ